ncbi:hypothetical protein L1D54_00490 [Vibrio brasiliensis]|uniref:hypothetical protein n=1 Tax=Vibrio brasiliensis TaxID=170652 RepID=UPI001EFC3895|nr:hypothetical protein [Vibrio brasiliensis]MCG9748951.1 hypothetical protein [Vibrio brasiliensis]MCG9782093.1 hypothetical protein [Vibrio brasiliensis]
MNIKSTMPLFSSILASMTLMAGCGGGGGGGDEGASSGGSASFTAASAQTQNITDLSISYDNSLESVYQVDVDVVLNQLAGKDAYISICDNAEAQGDPNQVDYDNCLVKSSLEDGLAEFDLRVVNHCESLIAVVWVMEPDQTPLVYTFDHDGQKQSSWLIQ